MRRTAKYVGACELALRLKVPIGEHETLYAALFERGYMWADGEWQELSEESREFRGSLDSIFALPDGSPSGVYRLRVMAHPEEIDQIVALLKKRLNIGEVSDKYPNRKGPGVRVYLTAKKGK